ncbi:DNA translocase FtsK [Chryseomicrobium palamuruense]|uniref:DNA translocase FtsK n=1 Tax=Chryseomicrobium palamuruense TaxID=682973 RepID=A0ABV8UX27_9BACL
MEWLKRIFRQEEEPEGHVEEYVELPQTAKKPPFRFPLISDEEKAYLLQSTHQSVDQSYIAPSKSTAAYKEETYFKPPRVYSEPIRQEVKPVTKSIASPNSRKRYVPSVVPSPVYGLKPEAATLTGPTRTMRTSHYDWSEAQKQEVQEQVVEEQQVQPPAEEQLATPEPAIYKEAQLDDAWINPVVMDVTQTNLPEEPAIEKEDVVEKIEEPIVEGPKLEEPKEKIKPFNVMMLSSDKKKWNEKQQQNSIVEEPPTEQLKSKEGSPRTEAVTVAPVRSYAMPNANFLHTPDHQHDDYEWMQQQADHLVEALAHFQIQAEIVDIVQGPAVTQFELTVGQGTKVSKIRNLTDDLKLALAAKDIRIQAPIPGRRSIGIEIPNRKSRAVQLAEVVESAAFKQAESPLEVAMGLDLHGQPVTMDLRKMPHGLIAGATGSGKSVFINSLLISLLYKASPSDLKLLLIDPKMVELAPFNHIPHLISPVITDVKAASASLKWAVEEMERRYQLFAHTGVRDINRFNQQAMQAGEYNKKLPFIVIVIDELADMMMAAPQDVEDAICRIAQKARACGIHLVLATQRPSVDVITGLIKSNVPTRIAFAVSSQIDSRTILDQQGAERLLGKGDMLYLGSGMASPVRIQGTYVSDEEIDRIIDHARAQGEPDYIFKQEDLIVRAVEIEEQDELFEEACRFIIEHGAASTSLLQRKFHLGYNRAARLMDAMEQAGIITSQNGSKPREVLVTEDFLQEIL